MQKYEVEVKSLLGSSERADQLRTALKAADPKCALVSKNKQLNHYFEPSTTLGSGGGALQQLAPVLAPHLGEESRAKLADFSVRAKSFSVRTRFAAEGGKEKVLFVVKASVGDDTSENGVMRMEIEESVSLSLDELDKLILLAGFTYQAKWSREREEYSSNGTSITLDKNAGYGWLAEFERMVSDKRLLDEARAGIASLMDSLGVRELPQDRLERMFKFYNSHWREYYGTDKIFTVE
ncbi:MAG: CYTH domain-containing protein [Patescibacteria group bacterium]